MEKKDHPYGQGSLRLAGIRVDEADVKTLVDLLLRVGRADDVMAAGALERGLALDGAFEAISLRERNAILDVLDDPPEGLVELRDQLVTEWLTADWARRDSVA